MAPTKNPAARLRHIIDEAEAIRGSTRDINFDTFCDSWTVRRAVEHGLLIITEASKALPSELKAAYPAIPWTRLESLGNVLRHDYQDIDPKALWRIVEEQLPKLITTAREMLAKVGN